MSASLQSIGLRWAIGLGVAATVLACVAVGSVVWVIIIAVVRVMVQKRTRLSPTPRLIERSRDSSARNA